jgi:hypothetical protein
LQLATASTVLASLIVLIIIGACVYVRAIGRAYGYVSDDLSAHTRANDNRLVARAVASMEDTPLLSRRRPT